MAIIVDIETIPQAREKLEAMMPEEIKNPVMPPEIANPEEPNWEEKAPEYSLPALCAKLNELTAKAAATPEDEGLKKKIAEAEAKRATAAEKRAAWIRDNKGKFDSKTAAAKAKWDLEAKEKRWKFIEDAALDARLGHVKLLGMRDTITDLARIFVWEPDKTKAATIRTWFGGLPKHESATGKRDVRTFRERPLIAELHFTEAAAVAAFHAAFVDGMETGTALEVKPVCVTFYGNTFDFPFIHQRAWILGAPIVPLYRRGRYWDETRMVDLHEVWTFGDRSGKTGGLDGLARALGSSAVKTQDGAKFYEWYEKDPIEGICYLVGDLDLTEFCGGKMGVIRAPKNNSK